MKALHVRIGRVVIDRGVDATLSTGLGDALRAEIQSRASGGAANPGTTGTEQIASRVADVILQRAASVEGGGNG